MQAETWSAYVVFKAWMSTYIAFFYEDILIYQCSNPNAGLATRFW